MPAVPPVFVGKHLSSCVAVGQSVAADGTLTDAAGASKTLASSSVFLVRNVRISQQNALANRTGINQTRRNMVKTEAGTRISMGVMILANGENPLTTLAQAYDYLKLTLTRGGQTWTFYGLIESYDEDLQKEGGDAELVLEMCDIGSANPAYA